MTFEDDHKGDRRRKADAEAKSEKKGAEMEAADAPRERPRKRNLPPSNVGDALKSAYDRTLHEDIPPEMLDLLGKLG